MFRKIMVWLATLLLMTAVLFNMMGQDATFLMLCAIYSAIVVLWPRAALGEKE
jgi:hypothetical protein